MNKYSRFIYVLFVFLAVHLLLNVWMWGIRQVLPAVPPAGIKDLYKGVPLETNPWLEPWQRWDSPQYQAIASRGYTAFDTALFTPPLFPWLMKLFTPVFGGNSLLAGMVVSGLAGLLCMFAFLELGLFEYKDEPRARRAVLYLATFPTAFFLFAGYAESLFLLGAVMSLFSARKNKWFQAGAWGAVVALTRSPGILIFVPLAWAAWSAWRNGDRKAWQAPVITLAGASIFPVYVSLGMHLSPLAILSAVGRGGNLAFPGWNLVVAVSRVVHGQLLEENLIELGATLLFILLTVFVWKKLPHLYGIYSVALMALFLTRLGSPQPLVSMARYVIEIFPAFLVLAEWGGRPVVNRVILYLSWLGLLFFSAQFAIWGWVG